MEGDTMGVFEVPLLYFLTCVLVTWSCSVCENSPNCVLMIYELFYMYIIRQLKVRNISIKRTQIRKIHQGLIHHTNFSQPQKYIGKRKITGRFQKPPRWQLTITTPWEKTTFPETTAFPVNNSEHSTCSTGLHCVISITLFTAAPSLTLNLRRV